MRRHALFSVAATRAIEAHSAAALPAHTLMQRAGAAVARLALAVAPHARHVWVAAGPGNNGGDGFEAAAELRRLGKTVHVTLAGDPQRLPADAQASFARAQAAGVSIATDGAPELGSQDIAIDALLGIGTNRPPQGSMAGLIERLNALRCAVLAVDVPSGLNADTGQPVDAACVVARHTLALLTLKPGLFTGSGRDQAGRVWLDTLGIDANIGRDISRNADRDDAHADPAAHARACAWLTSHADALALQPPRRHAHHKGSFGDVVVVGGAAGMTGAALLAARAAHAAGAGRVFVQLLEGASITHDLLRPELMLRPDWASSAPQVLGASTVVCGCGGGEAVRAPLSRLLSRVPRLVLDADALNAIATDSMLQALLTARHGAGCATVLTPHPLEAARLLGQTTAEVQADRLAAAAQLAQRFRCVVLLKGSGTVVAALDDAQGGTRDSTPTINPTGNASLAGAGTGDVLAGWLGGMWAQAAGAPQVAAGGPVASPASIALRVAQVAAFMHGAAADAAMQSPLRASDLIEQMHRGRSAWG
ncbi:MAG: hypothetical protein AD742_13465 [Methylibium sp. NZG]|nr:MAG: hypothetical protein AD742_13465 [Methylibium sp. NZG]